MLEPSLWTRRGRTRRHEVARPRTIAIVAAVALIVVVGLIAAPDRTGVTRAAARTRHYAAANGSAAAPVTVAPTSGLTPSWRPPAEAAHATVTFAPVARTIALPRSFFGFSVEVWDTLHDARYLKLFKRAVQLVRVPGDGPEVLRVGGNSTDQSYWRSALPAGRPTAFELRNNWLAATNTLVRALHARLILGLNAVARSPSMASRLARAVVRTLPAHSVIGFEIGNEPDLYWYRFRVQFAAESRSILDLAAQDRIFSAAGYADTFSSYAAALRRVAPRVSLVGPAVSNPLRARRWLTDLIARDRASLGLLTAHRYPLSACVHTISSPAFPTIGRLLSERASAGMAASVAPAVALAHRAGLRFRLTEFNSVTCLGRAGVSNAFATALWAPDALFEMLRARVDGVNMHLRTDSYNAPFVLSSRGFDARPAFYGLVAFARTLGPDARLTPVTVRGAGLSHLKVWGVLVRRHVLHVLVIDKAARSVRLALRLRGARGTATVQRLIAPSVRSLGGVTFAGQSLNTSGHWVGRKVVQRVAPRRAGYRLSVRGYSAALVSVRLRGWR